MLNISDAVGQGAGGGALAVGSVAQRLLACNMNIKGLRTLDVLRKEEWRLFDQAVVDIARERLGALDEIMSRGLTFNLSNPLGTTQLEWETISDMNPAEINMSGVTPGANDRVTFALTSMPIPIVHKDFNINIRALMASRNRGETLDTTQVRVATRKVSEQNELMLFDGASITVSGTSILGLTTATQRNTGSLSSDWADTVNTTGEEIVGDVLAMIAANVADNMFGPYVMYVPTDYGNRLSDDYKAASDRTIRERILAIPEIEGIRTTARLAGAGAGEVLLVQMTSDVVEIVNGMQPTMLQWESNGGMVTNFKVMSILVPRIRNDQLNNSGIAHFSV